MPCKKSISSNEGGQAVSRKASAKCTLLGRRRAPGDDTRRPFLLPSEGTAQAPAITVRGLAPQPEQKRRRRSSRPPAFAFSLPRRQQLAMLEFPELQRELAQRRRVFLTELGLCIMGAGFGLNATARILRVSAARLCVWCQAYRRSGASGLRSQSAPVRSCRPAPCRISFFLAL